MPRFQPSGRSTRAAFSTPSTSSNRIGTSVVADMWVPPRPLQTNAQEPTVDPSLQPRGDVFNPWLASRTLSRARRRPRSTSSGHLECPCGRIRPTMPNHEQALIAINRVLADRADEFEAWLRTVVVPVMNDHRPNLRGRWRVLRATEADDGPVVFAFVCEGGAPGDWLLNPVLEEALGQEGAKQALATFSGMLREHQRGWWFNPVNFDDP